jgi:ParB-like chromosome segregation protein Spo0J
MKKEGMINPLLCIQEGDRYAICIGNNRYLAGVELGYKEMPIKVVTSEVPKDLMAATEDYIPTEVEGYPSRRRAYEASKK